MKNKEPYWYQQGKYHDEYKLNVFTTLFLRKRNTAMDTVWWYLTGKKPTNKKGLPEGRPKYLQTGKNTSNV